MKNKLIAAATLTAGIMASALVPTAAQAATGDPQIMDNVTVCQGVVYSQSTGDRFWDTRNILKVNFEVADADKVRVKVLDKKGRKLDVRESGASSMVAGADLFAQSFVFDLDKRARKVVVTAYGAKNTTHMRTVKLAAPVATCS